MTTIISVGSGKGGVGKSVVASNLALIFARQGKRVIIADLDIGGANIHVMFGHFKPNVTMDDFLSHKVHSLDETAIRLKSLYGLKMIAGAGETLHSANIHYAKKMRLIRAFRKLDADVVIVDLGPGTGYLSLDFFLLGDFQVAVTTADPASIVDVYRFIKLSAIRKALSPFLQRDFITRNVAAREYISIEHVLSTVEQLDQESRMVVEDAMKHFKPCLILNRISENSRFNIQILRSLLKEYVGKDLNVLGTIPEDKAVESSVRNFLPVTLDAPGSQSTAAFRKVARSLQLLMQMSQA